MKSDVSKRRMGTMIGPILEKLQTSLETTLRNSLKLTSISSGLIKMNSRQKLMVKKFSLIK